MDDPNPMTTEDLRRLMSDNSPRSMLEQRRNERRTDRSQLGLAIGMVIAQRRWHDWAWLDEDTSRHRP